MSGSLVQWDVGILEIIVFVILYQKQYKVKEITCIKFSETTGIEIQSQNWGGNRQLSIGGVTV